MKIIMYDVSSVEKNSTWILCLWIYPLCGNNLCMNNIMYDKCCVWIKGCGKKLWLNFSCKKKLMVKFGEKKNHVGITSAWRISCMIQVVYEEMDVEKNSFLPWKVFIYFFEERTSVEISSVWRKSCMM